MNHLNKLKMTMLKFINKLTKDRKQFMKKQ